MDQTPFDAKDELYHKLYVTSNQRLIRRKPKLVHSISAIGTLTTEKTHLPSQPRIGLQDPDMGKYLESELVTRELNKLAPHL